MYGIKPPSDAAEEAALESQSKGDIADTIAAELEEMKGESKKSKVDHTFLPVRSGIECVFFMKTRSPVEPVAFVDRICDDAAACEDVMEQRKLRHINRLTPVVAIGKSLDKGLEKVGRDVLRGHLELNAEEGDGVEERAEILPHTVRAFLGRYHGTLASGGMRANVGWFRSMPSGLAFALPRL